jgi:peroxiredoxin
MRKLALTALTVLASVASVQAAEVGAAAPDFALKDLDGKEVKLADLKGKVVVLEWFNPECPFVKASHTKGSLVGTAKKASAKGVVWLAINSAASGKQGAGAEKNKEGKKTFGLDHPVLLDEAGTVGKAYGATNTPHMFVIDKSGKLAYKGAIDNSPDGEGQSPVGGKLINYVDAAIEDLAAGRPIKTAATNAYGCSVKYAK